jgi:hypothetical protein
MHSKHFFAPIAALDLDPIKLKLMHQESGEGWSRAYADAVESEYRRFLYLVKIFPKDQVAPLFDVDVFWHYHILDTMKYAADCEAVFGYFLHHFPYVGLRGEEDLQARDRVGERMRELYEQIYGEECLQQEVPAYAAAPGQVDFSFPSAEKTLSIRTGKVASASPSGKTAVSSRSGPVASSFPAGQFSFCAPMTESGAPGDAVGIAGFDTSGGATPAPFYSVRPTMSRAA